MMSQELSLKQMNFKGLESFVRKNVKEKPPEETTGTVTGDRKTTGVWRGKDNETKTIPTFFAILFFAL